VNGLQNKFTLLKALAANPRILRVSPAVNWFLTKYMRKFPLVNLDGQLIIHSHLPSVNSKAFTRFIDEHLLARTPGPSHAQISLTGACPQSCQYCYNKDRSGAPLTTNEIKQSIAALKRLGVFWLGFTGGEPLLQPDIVEIVRSTGDDCALKLFTTGMGLTQELANRLKEAGLLYVSISLDHQDQATHDQIRGCTGSYQAALLAIEMCQTAGFHVSVSSVIPRAMLQGPQIDDSLKFLIGLGVHEAWLSETKPTQTAFWDEALVITEADRLHLVEIQDRYNQMGKITVNYLGHFEGKECFGCNAGHKMVYIDAFGEVSPCVFTPMSFGNIRDNSLGSIFAEMKALFPSESDCFINRNYPLLKKHYHGQFPLSKTDTLQLLEDVQFSPLAQFSRLLAKR
jgi:MoaA/NifB/PqqE/SkfB family radical SAM enzyme